MKIGRIAAAAAVIAVCAALFASCGKDNSDEATASAGGDSETATSSEQTSDTTETTTESRSESGSETETDDTPEDSEVDISDAVSGNALMPIADAALAVGEWPTLWEISEPDLLSEYFLLDRTNSNYRNMLVLQCPMSANMTEIIIIEAENISEAKSDLEARQKKAREQDAFYPADVERAGASVVGTEGDYAYFIMGDNVSDAEKAITDYIKAG